LSSNSLATATVRRSSIPPEERGEMNGRGTMVDVVKRPRPVPPSSFAVGEPPEGVEVRACEQRQPVVEIETLAVGEFSFNTREVRHAPV